VSLGVAAVAAARGGLLGSFITDQFKDVVNPKG
jgi:hypothetical protein